MPSKTNPTKSKKCQLTFSPVVLGLCALIWRGLPKAERIDSRIASEIVGWGRIKLTKSSRVASKWIAIPTSPKNSPAFGDRMWIPNTSPVLASANNLYRTNLTCLRTPGSFTRAC